MKIIILPIFLLLYVRLIAQTDSVVSVNCFEVIRFINAIRNEEIKKDSFLLLDKPAPMDAQSIRDYISKAKDNFSEKDTSFMINQVNHYLSLSWDSTWIENVAFLERQELTQLIKRTKNGSDWGLFYKKHGRRYYWLSFPIFSVDRQYCIIEIGYACGDLCAESRIMVFERQGEIWKRIKVLEHSIS